MIMVVLTIQIATPMIFWTSFAGLIIFLSLAIGAILLAGTLISAPAQRPVEPPPDDLKVVPVSFSSASGTSIHGWWIPQLPSKGGIILMHGFRTDRSSMLDRAKFLGKHGYSVLLFDFQAHGESPGKHMTFGHLESLDAEGAMAFMRSHCPTQKIVALGFSLGGAACLLGAKPLAADAMILEAVFPDIHSAMISRINMRLPALGPLLAPFLSFQMKPRLGVSPMQLRPIEAIRKVNCPLFLVAGTDDRHTPLRESEQLYAAAPEPKEMWAIDGAAHVDFYHYAQKEYEEKILGFLDRL